MATEKVKKQLDTRAYCLQGKDPKKKFKIVHFEDDKKLLEQYSKKLTDAGFDYVGFTDCIVDPKEIVTAEKPDLVLTNMIMPSMDGFKLTEKLQCDKKTQCIPIVALTKVGQEPDKKKGLELGMTAYLIKAECTPDDVVKKLNKVLGC